MNQEDIYNNVVRIVSKHAKDPDALRSIHPETHILNDLKVNSARLVDIVLDFEGSNIESIARFYKGFGAQEEIYPGIKLNNLPPILKLFRK